MVFTSVAGHLMELDFPDGLKKWHACSPLDLYTAPVVKVVPQVDQAIFNESALMIEMECAT